MYTLLLSLGVTLFIIFVPMLFGVGAQWTVLLGFILGIISFIWVGRRISRRIQAVTQASDRELATLQQLAQQRPGPKTQQLVARKFDAAIEVLKRGFIFEKWQLGASTMFNARVGMLLFSKPMLIPKARVAEAIPYLEKARAKGLKAKLLKGMWPAWAMLGVAYYRTKRDLSEVRGVFDGAIKVVKNDGLLYSVYAWILAKEKQTDAAIEVLLAAKKELPSDERIAENLNALQNGKNMKMRSYGEQWYQFGLEKPKAAQMKPQMSHPRARGARRR
ncbi:MAG: tetratricopeptide repeat protein [Bradymonadia bacterium]